MSLNSLKSINDFTCDSHVKVMWWGSARVYSNSTKEYIRLKELADKTRDIAENLISGRHLTTEEKSLCSSIHARLTILSNEADVQEANGGIILKIFLFLRQFTWNPSPIIRIQSIPTFTE